MLPDLIEIVPLSRRTDATVVLPGSKSLTNRGLDSGRSCEQSRRPTRCSLERDTQAMVNCLKRLGFCIEWRMIGPSRPTAPSRFTDAAGGFPTPARGAAAHAR